MCGYSSASFCAFESLHDFLLTSLKFPAQHITQIAKKNSMRVSATGAQVICGKALTRSEDSRTMYVDEALEALRLISPKKVSPCHYSAPLLYMRKFAVADDQRFAARATNRTPCCKLRSLNPMTIRTDLFRQPSAEAIFRCHRRTG